MIRFYHYLIITIISNIFYFGYSTNASDSISAPLLNQKSNYSEYWEQQFLFENGDLVTSQFMIANFPFSKHHGLMVATLKQLDQKTIVIKNGRKRSGWNYEANNPRLSIFSHDLTGSFPDFHTDLSNTAAEVTIAYSANTKPITLTKKDNSLGLPAITLYAPTATAAGKWRAGPEIGGDGNNEAWTSLGKGQGYGIHVVQDRKPGQSLKRWRRVISTSPDQQYQPILHDFITPTGEQMSALLLSSHNRPIIKYEDVQLSAGSESQTWTVRAENDRALLTGTIFLDKKLESFSLKDHLNGLEKLVAGSSADIMRDRYQARYEFDMTENNIVQKLSGRAIVEDITLGKQRKNHPRRRR